MGNRRTSGRDKASRAPGAWIGAQLILGADNKMQIVSEFLPTVPYGPQPGDLVYFWTGRGSHGYADLVEVRDDRYFISPHPSAHKGADYRPPSGNRPEYWYPLRRGVPLAQLVTPRRIWYQND